MIKRLVVVFLSFVLMIFAIGCDRVPARSDSIAEVAEYGGNAYVPVNENIPEFSADDYTSSSYEFYSDLDSYGRCGYAMACLGQDLMPTEDRKSISHVKPSGWVNNPYYFIDGEYLYNRCHLIGFQLAGENDNEKNLITGTRYMNVEGMLPFENMVADYISETDNHVLYRVTPVFIASNLLAHGVQMEAWSVEDNGAGICYNVYCYNVQPGVEIDYATGDNWVSDVFVDSTEPTVEFYYILNIGSKKFHASDCGQALSIKPENAEKFIGDRESLIEDGYEPAGCCQP